ncbi:endonuclease V [Geodermatophilus sp. SYSU D00815]
MHPDATWPADPDGLAAEQRRIAALRQPPWRPAGTPPAVAGVVAVGGDDAGGDAWAAAVLVTGGRVTGTRLVRGPLRAPYVPALRAAAEGPLLAAAVDGLPVRPDVLLVAAAGRDHPRRAGLAVHLGEVLDLPSVGVTDRPLLATGAPPGVRPGDTAPLVLDGAEVARWVRTRRAARPVAAHAAWRTGADVAAAVVLAAASGVRTPQALREARRLAREARARG